MCPPDANRSGHQLIFVGNPALAVVTHAFFDHQVILLELLLRHAIETDRNTECVGPLKLETDEIQIALWYPPVCFPFENYAWLYTCRVFNQRFARW